MMLKKTLGVAAILLLVAGCTESLTELGGMPSTNLNDGDNAFFKKMALANMAEIDTSKLAIARSDNDKVKAFAQHMIADHSKVSQQLSDLADAKGVILPVELDSRDQTKLDALSSKSGMDFDHSYMDLQVTAHKQAIAADQDEADNGLDPDTKTFAGKMLDTLKAHLSMAEQLQSVN
jgi:putative membrane protein